MVCRENRRSSLSQDERRREKGILADSRCARSGVLPATAGARCRLLSPRGERKAAGGEPRRWQHATVTRAPATMLAVDNDAVYARDAGRSERREERGRIVGAGLEMVEG